MADTQHPHCDKCKRPATRMYQDLIEIPSNTNWKEMRPFGKRRYGCEQHIPAFSRIYYIGQADYPERAINIFNNNAVSDELPNGVFVNCPYCQRRQPVSTHGFLLYENNMKCYCLGNGGCGKQFVLSFTIATVFTSTL